MIAAVTYSTDNFEEMRKINVSSAYEKGKVDKVFEFTPNDIDDECKKNNASILSYKRGAGLYLWKPYVIAKALSIIDDNDYLIYSEAASIYFKPIQYLIDSLNRSGQDIMVYELPLISKQWTKQETFVRMKCQNRGFEDRNQISASFILLRKTAHSVKFINDYLNVCCDEVAISYKQFDNTIANAETFIAHREDQSIFSILSMSYDLKPFRDPSQLGSRPWEYILSKEVIYNPITHTNSNYPMIFLHTRKKIDQSFLMKHRIKSVLAKLPPYVKWEITRRSKK